MQSVVGGVNFCGTDELTVSKTSVNVDMYGLDCVFI